MEYDAGDDSWDYEDYQDHEGRLRVSWNFNGEASISMVAT